MIIKRIRKYLGFPVVLLGTLVLASGCVITHGIDKTHTIFNTLHNAIRDLKGKNA